MLVATVLLSAGTGKGGPASHLNRLDFCKGINILVTNNSINRPTSNIKTKNENYLATYISIVHSSKAIRKHISKRLKNKPVCKSHDFSTHFGKNPGGDLAIIIYITEV